MIIQHDNRPCTPSGHSAFVGYDATDKRGKLVQISPTGRTYTCVDCDRQFVSREARADHRCTPRWAE